MSLLATLSGSLDQTATQGSSVQMSGDGSTIAIGAPPRRDIGEVGHVYVFVDPDVGWRLQAQFDGPDIRGNSWALAVALSTDGSELAVGDYTADLVAPRDRPVSVFHRTGDVWVPPRNCGDRFRLSLASSATR